MRLLQQVQPLLLETVVQVAALSALINMQRLASLVTVVMNQDTTAARRDRH
jgi:hypothetical protein